MALFPAIGLGEAIVEELRSGPFLSQKLKAILRSKKWRFTDQGFYKALRALRKDELVFLHKGVVSLNFRWIQRLETFISIAGHAYTDTASGAGTFLKLADGDRIVYSFKNAVQVDEFWNHVLYTLFEAIPKLDRWYAYASHDWFLLCRRDQELALMKYLKAQNIRCLYTVGHSLPLDRAVAKDFDGTYAQYAMLEAPLFLKRKNNLGIVLNILGDYVIEAHYDENTMNRIESFYRKHNSAEPSELNELEEAVTRSTRIKFVISKNHSKAQKLSRSFDKYFYFGRK